MHVSSNYSISYNVESPTNSQHPTDQAVQDKNLTMDSKITDTNDVTIQEVLSAPSSKEPRSYRSVAASIREKQTEEKSNYKLNKEQCQTQDTKKDTKSERNNTGSASTVLQNDEFIGVQPNHIKTKRYYIGGIAEDTKKETIIHFSKSKGICPTLLNLFTSKRKGTLSTKMNIRVEDVEKIAV